MTKNASNYATTTIQSPTIWKLSKRHLAILRFVHQFAQQYGYAPTVREIGWALEIPSTSMVNYYLNYLDRKGYIRRSAGVSRSLLLLEAGYQAIGQTQPDNLQAEVSRLLVENRLLRERCEQLQRELNKLLPASKRSKHALAGQ